MEKKRVIIKIGSSSLQHQETGKLDFLKMERLVRELCDLRNHGMDVCLVSSGAIAVGRAFMGLKRQPDSIARKQACASVGQARLMMTYQKMFAEYHQTAGQVLMTKNTMFDLVARKNAQNTFEELFGLGVIPIVNENDTVSTYEMQFGDNDTLSALVASLVSADLGSDPRRPVSYGEGIHGERRGDRGDGDEADRGQDRHQIGGGHDYCEWERRRRDSQDF